MSERGMRPPETYGEWLDCLSLMTAPGASSTGVFEAVERGSFGGTPATLAALQRLMIETVNALLDRSARRFVRDLNDSINFNELDGIDLLFKRLKKDVKSAFFFEKLDFLPEEFRKELSGSARTQMTRFWDETKEFLYEQAAEYRNSGLEDALFLIRRLRLFE